MPVLNENTIYAPATVPGTGAISIIRISGPEAFLHYNPYLTNPQMSVTPICVA